MTYPERATGTFQKLCFASCYGSYARSMANAYNPAFDFLIANHNAVLQSNVTVAFLAFYNSFFYGIGPTGIDASYVDIKVSLSFNKSINYVDVNRFEVLSGTAVRQ